MSAPEGLIWGVVFKVNPFLVLLGSGMAIAVWSDNYVKESSTL